MGRSEKRIMALGVNALALGIVCAGLHGSLECKRILSGSMEGTAWTGDYVIANRRAYEKRTPERGDVILFDRDGECYCKRVVAVSGDEVSFSDGDLYLNGEKQDEDYIKDAEAETNSAKTFSVPEESCLVLGDNRENSIDSRHWEEPYVPYGDIRSRVMAVVPTHLASALPLPHMKARRAESGGTGGMDGEEWMFMLPPGGRPGI